MPAKQQAHAVCRLQKFVKEAFFSGSADGFARSVPSISAD